MKGGGMPVKTLSIFSFLLVPYLMPAPSLARLYLVQQNCTRKQVFTPVPSTVNNYCLQCFCIMTNIGYCRPLIVQFSIICSRALTPVPATIAATTTTARPTAPPVVLTNPTLVVPTAAPTTAVSINPRASSPAPAPAQAATAQAAPAMMSGAAGATMMMVTVPPMMMMMMMAAANASMTPAQTPAAPAPAG